MYFIYKYTQTCNLFKKKKSENFRLLFQKIFALKVTMHMCMKVKVRVNNIPIRPKRKATDLELGDEIEVLEVAGARERLAGHVEFVGLEGAEGERVPVLGGDAEAGDLEGVGVHAPLQMLQHGLRVRHLERGDRVRAQVEEAGAAEADHVALQALTVRRQTARHRKWNAF